MNALPKLATCCVLGLQPAPAAAQSSQPTAVAGVWEGTIGKLPVRACFNQRDWGTYGAYYYRSHLKAIPLQQPDGAPTAFVEGHAANDRNSPRWTIEIGADARLSGSWNQGGRTLPIRLSRVIKRLGSDETPCGSMLFHQPRLKGIRVVTKGAAIDGRRYTRLILDHRGRFHDSVSVETFALAGASPAIQRINRTLREPLNENFENWQSCVLWAWNSSPHGGDYSQSITPEMITRRWVTAVDSSGDYCGGAHPNSSESPLTFDLTTGEAIDLHDWFNDQAVTRERYDDSDGVAKKLTPPFRAKLLSSWKPGDSECRDIVSIGEYWSIALTRKAFRFTPSLPHVAQACVEEFALPFHDAGAYLTADARKNLKALQSDLSRR